MGEMTAGYEKSIPNDVKWGKKVQKATKMSKITQSMILHKISVDSLCNLSNIDSKLEENFDLCHADLKTETLLYIICILIIIMDPIFSLERFLLPSSGSQS